MISVYVNIVGLIFIHFIQIKHKSIVQENAIFWQDGEKECPMSALLAERSLLAPAIEIKSIALLSVPNLPKITKGLIEKQAASSNVNYVGKIYTKNVFN